MIYMMIFRQLNASVPIWKKNIDTVSTLFEWESMAKFRIVQVQYPLYALDIALSFLFPKLKIHLKAKIWGHEGH